MNDTPKGAPLPRTDFPSFKIGALHIPLQRIDMDRDALKLQRAILLSSDGIRRRWSRTNKAAAASRIVAIVAYMTGMVVSLWWLAGKAVS